MIFSLGLIMFNFFTMHLFMSIYGVPMYTSGPQAMTVCIKQSTDNVRQCVIMSNEWDRGAGAIRVHRRLQWVRKGIVEVLTVPSPQLLLNQPIFL